MARAQEAPKRALAVARDTGRKFERQSQLLASGAASQKTGDAARTARDQAAASVNAARAAHSQSAEGFRKEDIAAGQAHLTAAQAASAQAAPALPVPILLSPRTRTFIPLVPAPGSMCEGRTASWSVTVFQSRIHLGVARP